MLFKNLVFKKVYSKLKARIKQENIKINSCAYVTRMLRWRIIMFSVRRDNATAAATKKQGDEIAMYQHKRYFPYRHLLGLVPGDEAVPHLPLPVPRGRLLPPGNGEHRAGAGGEREGDLLRGQGRGAAAGGEGFK